jgi:hypothetical protein
MFATAPRDGFGFGNLHLFWGETGAFVGTIAQRLAPGSAAGAPPIRARFHFLNERRFLGNDGFWHNSFPFRAMK